MAADPRRLDGKAAVITGAGGGIGRATGVELGRLGASLLLVGRTEATLAESADAALEAGADVRTFVADVSVSEDVRGYVGAAVEAFGTIDVLVNNAGIEGPVAPLAEFPEEEFDRIIAINLRGTFLGMRYVLPIMLEQGSGSIVNLASVAAERGLPGTPAYNASKHGMLGLTRAAASEVASAGIRVNAISAGFIDTRMLRSLADQFMPGKVEEALEAFAAGTPARRLATPEEVAYVVGFLASDAASFVNATSWAVDGGSLGTMGGRWT
jgi:NAD(P)-dependent dehydrogenase (short-subunit alcohol dehydrogenase family)